MISNREILQLAIPADTTKTQWAEINRAIEYGKISQGVKVTVTQGEIMAFNKDQDYWANIVVTKTRFFECLKLIQD